MDSQLIEIELLKQAQVGDMDAFADLQMRLDSAIRRFVWRLIGTSPEEDDIVQDSMIALYLNLDRIQPADKLRAYLFRIVRNRCYDLLRKRRRYEQLSLDGIAHIPAHRDGKDGEAADEDQRQQDRLGIVIREALHRH